MHIPITCMHLSSNPHKATTTCFIYYCIRVSQTHTSVHVAADHNPWPVRRRGFHTLPLFYIWASSPGLSEGPGLFYPAVTGRFKRVCFSCSFWHRSFCSLGGQRGVAGGLSTLCLACSHATCKFSFLPSVYCFDSVIGLCFGWASLILRQMRYKHAEHLDAESLGVRSTFFVVVYIRLKSRSCYHSFYSCAQVSLQMQESLKIVEFPTGIFCPYIVSFFPGCLVLPPLIRSTNPQLVSDSIT